MALPTGWWERLDEMDDVEEATLLMRISGRGGRLSRSKSISPLHRRVLEAGIPKEGASVSDAAWRSAVRRSAQDEWRAIRGSTNGEEGAPPRPARFRGAPRRQPAPPQAVFASTAAPLQWSVDAPLLGPSRAV